MSCRHGWARACLVIAAVPNLWLWPSTARAADRCAECHATLDRQELKAPVAAVAADVHGKARITCSQCHGGNPSATKGNFAHVDGFVARPIGDAAARVCDTCHSAERDNWAKSPHALTKDQLHRASCTNCHGAHTVALASPALIAEPLCSSCHPIDAPRRIYKALEEPDRAATEVGARLEGKGDLGDLRAKLLQARSELRGLSHGMDLMAITRKSVDVLTTVDEVKAKAGPRIAARHWGTVLEWAVIVSAALIAGALAFVVIRWLWGRTLGRLTNRPSLFRGILVVLGVVAVAALIVGWRGYQYIQHSPNFCMSCHTMDSAWALWSQSAHRNVECHTCHESNFATSMKQLYEYATQRPVEVVKHARVDRAVCETCHSAEKSPSKWNRIAEMPGHKVHAGKERVQCVQCHATQIHRFRPAEQICGDCHRGVTLAAAGRMGEMHCLQCHPFAAKEGSPLRPDRAACLECHSETPAGETPPAGHARLAVFHEGGKDAPMEWACSKCHNPHKQVKQTSADCFKCHKDAVEATPVHLIRAHKMDRTDCVACHAPHAWKGGGCEACHGDHVPKVPDE